MLTLLTGEATRFLVAMRTERDGVGHQPFHCGVA
jgi:hypothetical protein